VWLQPIHSESHITRVATGELVRVERGMLTVRWLHAAVCHNVQMSTTDFDNAAVVIDSMTLVQNTHGPYSLTTLQAASANEPLGTLSDD
jgi:hypothetical protein